MECGCEHGFCVSNWAKTDGRVMAPISNGSQQRKRPQTPCSLLVTAGVNGSALLPPLDDAPASPPCRTPRISIHGAHNAIRTITRTGS